MGKPQLPFVVHVRRTTSRVGAVKVMASSLAEARETAIEAARNRDYSGAPEFGIVYDVDEVESPFNPLARHLPAEAQDALVHDTLAAKAAEINNQGTQAQLAFLTEHGTPMTVEQLFGHLGAFTGDELRAHVAEKGALGVKCWAMVKDRLCQLNVAMSTTGLRYDVAADPIDPAIFAPDEPAWVVFDDVDVATFVLFTRR